MRPPVVNATGVATAGNTVLCVCLLLCMFVSVLYVTFCTTNAMNRLRLYKAAAWKERM